MTEQIKYRNPARGAAGRAAHVAAAAERRADKARAELESQGYLVITPGDQADMKGSHDKIRNLWWDLTEWLDERRR